MRPRTELIFYISIGAGMALGTSSFLMVSGLFEVIQNLWVVLAVCLAGLFCIVIANSVAELASMYPSSPGIRTYLKVAFGNRISLFLVHLYLIFIVLIAGVESYVFALVITTIFPGVSPMIIVFVLLASVIITNLLGVELPRWTQISTAFILITSIMVLGLYGLFTSPLSLGEVLVLDFGNNFAHLKLLPAATAMAIFLFIGFEWVTPLGLRPRSYERRIPISMPLAIITNMIAYSCFVLGLNAQLTHQMIIKDSIPQVPYFIELFGNFGIYFAAALSILAIFSTFNAGVMGSSRLIYILTREGNLPKWCATISLRTGAPVGAILLLGGLAVVSSIIVVTFELELMAAVIGSAIICFVYAFFMLAVLRMRKSQPDMKRPFRTPVKASFQWALIVIMPLIGILSLFSLPTMPYQPFIGMIIFVVAALFLTRWSLILSKNYQVRAGEKTVQVAQTE